MSLIVVYGGSGTGKSTLCQALQETLLPEVWLHFSVDALVYGLPPSILERVNRHNDWSAVDPRLVGSSAYACASALLDAGHKVLFDCVILSERAAQAMMGALQQHRPVLVRLSCSWEETQRRTLARGDRTLQEAEHGFLHAGAHLRHDHVFDTTVTAPEAIARELTARLREA